MFVILLDGGVFVVDIEARGDAFGNHPGAEPARRSMTALGNDAPVEDQADAVRAPSVEVVADDMLEKHPVPCQNLSLVR